MKEIHGPYHGTKAGVVLRSEWQLDADKKECGNHSLFILQKKHMKDILYEHQKNTL